MTLIMHQIGNALLKRQSFSSRCSHGSVVGSLLMQSTRLLQYRAASLSSTMKTDSYAINSKYQYSAHLLTRDLLSASMERLAKRCNIEDRGVISDGMPIRRRRMVNLGSADGSSSMETLKFATNCLNNEYRPSGGIPMPLHITFEEHPASSKVKLEAVLNEHDEWFHMNDIGRDVLMQSFYEPLFEPGTIEFMMSYICLHWLDTTDVHGTIVDWKKLGEETDEIDASNLEWTHINEETAPKQVREAWRRDLAHNHLAKFLSLRSRELRPGAELLLVMVGDPHGFAAPGPLTRAMKRCISRGELREDVLHQTTVPYFLHAVSDVEAALNVAATLEVDSTETGGIATPGSLLQLVDCQSIPAIAKGDDDSLGGAFELFWSIHSHSIERANPTEEELKYIETETRRVFDELFDTGVGVPNSFVACTIRKRTRERWGA